MVSNLQILANWACRGGLLAAVITIAVPLGSLPAIADPEPLAQCERTTKDPYFQEDRKGKEIDPKTCASAMPAADIANAVYKDGDARQGALYSKDIDYTGDWADLMPPGADRDEAVKRAKESDFQAGVFEDKANGVVYVSFRGTENNTDDILTDLGRGTGRSTTQYELAETVADNAVAKYAGTGKKIVFVGHSLGGGLANHAAIHTGQEAVTFNADGMTTSDARRVSEGQGKKLKNIYMTGDPLHAPQDWDYGVDASPSVFGIKGIIARNIVRNGLKWTLVQPGELLWIPTKDACVGDGLSGMGESHRMATVIRTLNYCITDAVEAGKLPESTPKFEDAGSGDDTKPDKPEDDSGENGDRPKAPIIEWECQLSC